MITPDVARLKRSYERNLGHSRFWAGVVPGEDDGSGSVSWGWIESANDDHPGSGEVSTCRSACVVGQCTGGPVFTFALGVSSWIERKGLPCMVQSVTIDKGWLNISLLLPGGRAGI